MWFQRVTEIQDDAAEEMLEGTLAVTADTADTPEESSSSPRRRVKSRLSPADFQRVRMLRTISLDASELRKLERKVRVCKCCDKICGSVETFDAHMLNKHNNTAGLESFAATGVGKPSAATQKREEDGGHERTAAPKVYDEVDDEGNPITADQPRWCLCNRVSFGTMINCENYDQVSLSPLFCRGELANMS